MQSQVMLSLNAFAKTWSVGLAVFGVHILILGYLVFRSGYAPRVLGILLIIAFFGYTGSNSANLLIPGYKIYRPIVEWIFIAPMVIGEVGLGIWLLIKGKKVQPAI